MRIRNTSVLRPVLLACLLLAAHGQLPARAASAGRPTRATPAAGPFSRVPGLEAQVLVRWNAGRVQEAWSAVGFRRVRFPVSRDRSVELDLHPFRVLGDRSRFVLGRAGVTDRDLPYDPNRIQTFRGSVTGLEDSHVFLGLGPDRSMGFIDLGRERGRFAIRGTGDGMLEVRRVTGLGTGAGRDLPPEVPLCGLDQAPGELSAGATATEAVELQPYIQQIELAVDTDHEFYQLFGDPVAAADYLVLLYAQVSDIYLRDVNARVDLTFARIWDTPTDPYVSSSNPLPEFRNYWNANMGAVQRDAAQLVSGRRDYPFGGQAYLSSLCGSSAYSVVGYTIGYFDFASFNYDIGVTAHELGHNAGTGHTHSSPNFVDTCDVITGAPQRGTIMSYCPQTWSGGRRVWDLYFHSVIQLNIEAHVGSSFCVVDDCNGNGVSDATDIGTVSSDANGNGVPDECEDCNTNLVLDDVDIASATSQDLNNNTLPDECEPDCNQDNIPDDKNITDGTSLDLYGNGIPDECEEDCDENAVSDYTQIQGDMPLDIDRNARLDDCQDCDDDGTNDLDALGGAHNVWVARGQSASTIGEFHGQSGVRVRTSAGAVVQRGQDLIVTPDGRVLVSSADDDRVLSFDLVGSYLGDLVPSGAGGLDHPTGLLWAPDGRLLVASENTDSVLAFDGFSGAVLGALVAPGTGGLADPFGLVLGPAGTLYVTSGGTEVLEFDVDTGAFLATFVSLAGNGGLDQARGLTFKPDGNLLVASYGSDQVLEYDGFTGASLGQWAQVGTATVLTQVSPWGIRMGPNGNVFVGRTGEAFGSGGSGDDDHGHGEAGINVLDVQENHLLNAQMYEYDVTNGLFLRAHISGNDHGLEFPTGFDFVPGSAIDCNWNFLPDSCDVTSGTSSDCNLNSIPDECESDCDGNGTPDDCDVPIPPCAACAVDADCDDGVACTIDTCDSLAGSCSHGISPGTCWISGTCYLDGDLHPQDDCQACDPTAPTSWSPALATEVTGVTVDGGLPAHLEWLEQGAGVVYDVTVGNLALLRSDGNVSGAICTADDLPGSGWDDPAATPVSGDGSYYLLRAEKTCSIGNWGLSSSGTPRLPAVDCP